MSIAGSPGASITVSTGSGNDTITGSDQADNVTAGAGTDNITTDSATVASADADNVTTGTGTDTVNIFSVAGSSANADLISDFSPGTGGDILSFDLSLLETDGAIDVGEVIDFSELFDGSSVADSDAASIQEIAVAAGATVVAANVNMIAIIGTVATTDALETLLEAGGGAPLTINAAGGDVTSSFPVIYSDATNGFVAVCFAETETANDTTFEATDLVCRNVARLSGNAAITAAEFVAANFDFVP
ncbi:MAG: hypothetical protein HOP29_11090 [Phycisphaerales bacterium]|nr:hypothetical protein [Phycisphaerales bacterium]